MNDLKSGFRGPNIIDFPDGGQVRFNTVDFKIGGTLTGERSIKCHGNVLYEDLKSGLRALIAHNTYQASGWFGSAEKGSRDGFEGVIY